MHRDEYISKRDECLAHFQLKQERKWDNPANMQRKNTEVRPAPSNFLNSHLFHRSDEQTTSSNTSANVGDLQHPSHTRYRHVSWEGYANALVTASTESCHDQGN